MKEAEITKAIRFILDLIGIYHWKQWQGPMSTPKGVADILGITKVKVADLVAQGTEEVGIFTAIEVKTKTGKLSAHQEKFLNEVKANGGITLVARSADDVIEKYGVQNRFKMQKKKE